MSEKNLADKLINEERVFLHDISNNIVVAHGMMTFVLRTVKENPSVEKREIERLEKAIEAINRMTDALRERRELIHRQQEII